LLFVQLAKLIKIQRQQYEITRISFPKFKT
jgi:hypothetical protein